MKKVCGMVLKILIILFIIQIVRIPTSQASFWGDIFEMGDEFLNEAKSQNLAIDQNDMKEGIQRNYNIMFASGVALSVVVGARLGIKFMMGSVEEKVEVKESLIAYVVGCVSIFGAFGIWRLVVIIMNNVA